jgi:hypothetical protein
VSLSVLGAPLVTWVVSLERLSCQPDFWVREEEEPCSSSSRSGCWSGLVLFGRPALPCCGLFLPLVRAGGLLWFACPRWRWLRRIVRAATHTSRAPSASTSPMSLRSTLDLRASAALGRPPWGQAGACLPCPRNHRAPRVAQPPRFARWLRPSKSKTNRVCTKPQLGMCERGTRETGEGPLGAAVAVEGAFSCWVRPWRPFRPRRSRSLLRRSGFGNRCLSRRSAPVPSLPPSRSGRKRCWCSSPRPRR